jgi:hypothetical protein
MRETAASPLTAGANVPVSAAGPEARPTLESQRKSLVLQEVAGSILRPRETHVANARRLHLIALFLRLWADLEEVVHRL